jgi:hypothetical protein
MKRCKCYSDLDEFWVVGDFIFTRERFEFDGNTPLKPGRLKVMKIALVPVEQPGG